MGQHGRAGYKVFPARGCCCCGAAQLWSVDSGCHIRIKSTLFSQYNLLTDSHSCTWYITKKSIFLFNVIKTYQNNPIIVVRVFLIKR